MYRSLVILIVSILACTPLLSQRAAARYEIDAKRSGVQPTDRDAMPRGREFIRLDSTYYVGWMYQGLYLHDRSADVAGYQRALPFMRKAFLLLDNDYGGVLTTIFNDPMIFIQNQPRLFDYVTLARSLRETYEYLEMPDSAMWVLRIAEQKQFKRDFVGIATSRAWIIHRNRFYTSKQFGFLGNSVAENEALARAACYRGFEFIRRNAPQNNMWFGEGHAFSDRHFIYHYLSLIHSYEKNYDSSNYYYEQMAEAGTVSWNNYGSLKAEIGEFAEAMEMYNMDRYKNMGVKYLMEPYYYLPILHVYAGKPLQAVAMAKEAIQYSNSSPGFGWYNIALARSLLYNGQLDSAAYALDKAASFKEIHIGTTLTQPQYDFTVGLLRLNWLNKKIAAHTFLHRNWWYNPALLYDYVALRARKYMHEYVLATQLALNPERQRIIYDLFCGESTVGYDEIYDMMARFSPEFFIGQMEKYLVTDNREKIKPYYQLFRARLLGEVGKHKASREALEQLHQSVRLDTSHQKLFMGRLFESLAVAAQKDDDAAATLQYTNELLKVYPELIPFSKLAPRLQLEYAGNNNGQVASIKKDIENTAMEWAVDPELPKAQVSFGQRGAKQEVVVRLVDANNTLLMPEQRILFQHNVKGLGGEIVLRLFGKSGGPEWEPVQNQQ